MLTLDIAVDTNQVKSAAPSLGVPMMRRSKYANTRQELGPVKEVQLSWAEEQLLYDRMYEAQVYKRGYFFGYRSTIAQRWHK